VAAGLALGREYLVQKFVEPLFEQVALGAHQNQFLLRRRQGLLHVIELLQGRYRTHWQL
jgi:hypothetical protein